MTAPDPSNGSQSPRFRFAWLWEAGRLDRAQASPPRTRISDEGPESCGDGRGAEKKSVDQKGVKMMAFDSDLIEKRGA